MFFLIRCIFWLGLVFSHIAALEVVTTASLAQNVAQGASKNATSLGRMAMETAARKCSANPAACLALASKASRIVAKSAAGSRDTLRADDRFPAWRQHAKSENYQG